MVRHDAQALPPTPGISPAAAAHLAKTNGTLLISGKIGFLKRKSVPPVCKIACAFMRCMVCILQSAQIGM